MSFVIAGVACALAALCYAELASAVPVAGSAYTFSFATLAERAAWTTGWNLVLTPTSTRPTAPRWPPSSPRWVPPGWAGSSR
nr:hypothetical protein [Kocuria sediminis]